MLYNNMNPEQSRIPLPQSRPFRTFVWTACIVFALTTQAVAQTDPGQVAFSLEREGRFAEAEQAWEALAKQYPTNPEPLAHMGLIESKQARYAEAIQHYRKAMALNPAMPGLRLNLGLALFKNRDYQQAIAHLEPLRKSHPEDQQLTILIGMSQYALGHFSIASRLLKQASTQDPKNLTLLLTLAHSCLWSKQYGCVQEAFHRIVLLNADSAEAEMLMGEALDDMKDHEGAIRQFRAAAKANPKEPNVHFGLGYLLWTKGQYPEAAAEFQAELANDPQHLKARLYLGDARMQMNQSDAARPILEQVVKADPSDGMAHRDLAIILAEQGKKEEALKEFQAAIKLNPKDVNAHYRLGRLYRSMGRAAEAKRELDQASTLNKAEDERLLKVMSTIPATKSAPNPEAHQPH
ncbi:MAG TPA: tetratricopeptide repeat protein [Terracidiphilus sp.]|jgi:tetratricopeptide (TPR) repeat protein|nr:tetratricopeptide repeat protein [Terracidiphilus sp.]